MPTEIRIVTLVGSYADLKKMFPPKGGIKQFGLPDKAGNRSRKQVIASG